MDSFGNTVGRKPQLKLLESMMNDLQLSAVLSKMKSVCLKTCIYYCKAKF